MPSEGKLLTDIAAAWKNLEASEKVIFGFI